VRAADGRLSPFSICLIIGGLQPTLSANSGRLRPTTWRQRCSHRPNVMSGSSCPITLAGSSATFGLGPNQPAQRNLLSAAVAVPGVHAAELAAPLGVGGDGTVQSGFATQAFATGFASGPSTKWHGRSRRNRL
jgi:hypothetical protein